ncbi:unnamed protein product, partial [Hapterophycus canaliculatus]
TEERAKRASDPPRPTSARPGACVSHHPFVSARWFAAGLRLLRECRRFSSESNSYLGASVEPTNYSMIYESARIRYMNNRCPSRHGCDSRSDGRVSVCWKPGINLFPKGYTNHVDSMLEFSLAAES